MTISETLNPATGSPSLVAGEHGRVVGLEPISASPGHYRPRQYTQAIRVLVGLLKCYGKLDPEATVRTLREISERLAADIRKDHTEGIESLSSRLGLTGTAYEV